VSGNRYTHVPSDTDPSTYVSKEADHLERLQVNRRQTLRSLLRFARDNVIGAVGLVELTEMIGLDEELTELAGAGGDVVDIAERHRRIEAALLELGLSVDELEDRSVAADQP
jgi:hypothetical protein